MNGKLETIEAGRYYAYAGSRLEAWTAVAGRITHHSKHGSGVILKAEISDSGALNIWVRFDNDQDRPEGRRFLSTAFGGFFPTFFTELEVSYEILQRVIEYEHHRIEEERERIQREAKEKQGKASLEQPSGFTPGSLPGQALQRHARSQSDDKCAEIQTRAARIKHFCLKRNITTLVHFTHVRNLNSILHEGLLSREVLETWPRERQPRYNDSHRLDKRKGAICLSISFPNYRMFYKYSMNNRAEWVVLLLNAAILWELDCAFCQENAASSAVTRIPLADRKQADVLISMFADYSYIRRQDLQIPNNYPTHPQAEVLVLVQIPPHYIDTIHFYNREAYRAWLSSNAETHPQRFDVSQQYFQPRQDYEKWISDSEIVPAPYSAADDFYPEDLPF